MATDRLINQTQGTEIIDALTAITNAIGNIDVVGLHVDWSYTVLPATGNSNIIYAIPTGDTEDPYDFYAWNDSDQEFVQIDFKIDITIDSAMSSSSTNPVQNAVITTALADKVDVVSGKGLSTNDFTDTLKTKLDGIEAGAQVNPTIDSALSDSSENAVQNKVVTAAVSGTKTATGNPVTLTDAAEINAEEVVASIEPIQDLHGYDKPWVGGAGKNKLNIDDTIKCGDGESRTKIVTLSPTIGAGTYTLSFQREGTSTGSLQVEVDGTYRFYVSGDSFTVTTGITKIYFYIDQEDYDQGKYCVFKNLQIEEGSTATSYEPYTNICPISGLTSVDVESVGKNLHNKDGIEYGYGISSQTYQKVSSNNSWMEVIQWNSEFSTLYLKVYTKGTYTGSFTIRASEDGVLFDDIVLDSLQFSGISDGYSATFTIPTGSKYIAVYGWMANNDTGHYITTANIEISNSENSTTYEPYHSSNATTPLGRTVYGGTLNVTTGVLTVDKYFVEFDGTEDWSSQYSGDNTLYQIRISDIVTHSAPSRDTYGCSHFVTNFIVSNNTLNGFFAYTSSGSPGDTTIRIRPDLTTFSTLASFKAYLVEQYANNTPLQGYFELATPTTYQLTTAEVALLADYCTVSTNADDLSVVYWVDNSIGTLIGKIQSLEARVKALEEA